MGTVLIVDDDVSTREVVSEILANEQLEIATASNGEACLAYFRGHQPDLVLLDVRMPGAVNGFEVCRRLKSSPDTKLVPIILLTALSALRDRVEGLKAGADDFLSKPVESSELLARVHSLLSLKRYTDELETAESVLFSLARSIEGKDPYTLGHCERLSEYSVTLGTHLGLGEDQLTALRRGGIVHDIGKVIVPEAVLLKPGPLTPEERKIVEEHPAVGERICQPLRSMQSVLPIIRHHHEKWDGTGYPDGLRGEAIPLLARILQTVDVYDALRTERPYRKALSRPEALSIMEDETRKGWWDKKIFRTFASMDVEFSSFARTHFLRVANAG